jgi:hypothetical protein
MHAWLGRLLKPSSGLVMGGGGHGVREVVHRAERRGEERRGEERGGHGSESQGDQRQQQLVLTPSATPVLAAEGHGNRKWDAPLGPARPLSIQWCAAAPHPNTSGEDEPVVGHATGDSTRL